ncbi:hypothetical protein [Cryobacterium fucosi]|uniref:Uncharacterized protein n=1 Tax=Cryobacterium fucosi TaxID=1259157 RepID=A0A4R9BAA6_9MICO|nr:hypothetical protein [Cryobacterium fucosi]TFD79282.1 hypothetical protein E3T48_06620 [Cryobacterium fucosi]
MKSSLDPRVHRRLIALIAAGALVLIMAVVGIYGLVAGHQDSATPKPITTGTTTAPSTSVPSPVSTPQLSAIPHSRDPEKFAQSVANALFTWDTGSGFMPLDYTVVILDVGDPSGTEQAGLASDVATYLPTREAWVDLRRYATTQSLTIEAMYVPDAWAGAVAQARPGQLPPGAAAYTIEGTRHREGIWNGQPTSTDSAVSFTAFVACPPDGDPCYLLRLSQLDNPLK